MKEYGNAVSIQLDHDGPADDATTKAAIRLLDFNYKATAAKNPKWGLPEEYLFIVGPIHPVYATEECSNCNGMGTWGKLVWECERCRGVGLIVTDKLVDPPRWHHVFAWYVRTEDSSTA